MSGAGDVNGDGYSDIVIGASGADPIGPHYSPGQSDPYAQLNAGTSYVIFGHSKDSPFPNIDLSSNLVISGIGFKVFNYTE